MKDKLGARVWLGIILFGFLGNSENHYNSLVMKTTYVH